MELGIGVLHIIGDGKYFGRIESASQEWEAAVGLDKTDGITVSGAVDTVSAPASLCVISGLGKPNPGGVIDLQPE